MGKGPAPAGLKIVVSSLVVKRIPSLGTVRSVSFRAVLISSPRAAVPTRRAITPARKAPAMARTAIGDAVEGSGDPDIGRVFQFDAIRVQCTGPIEQRGA